MKSLRLLLIEDSEDDELLLLREFRKAGYELLHQRVQTARELANALEGGSWELVVSDFQMPDFSGMEALSIVHAHEQDLPFVILSGAIGEQTAVEAMQAGANDYIMKDNLSRLLPAVERALREAANQRQRRQAEQQLEEVRLRMEGIIASAMDAIVTVDGNQHIVLFNNAAEQLFGYKAQEVQGKNINLLMPERYRHQHATHVDKFTATGKTTRNLGSDVTPIYGLRSGGEEFPIEASISQVEVNGQKFCTIIIRDITERLAAVQKLAEEKQRLELALIGGNLGMWDWDVARGTIVMNKHWARILGYASEELELSIAAILARVHPDDLGALGQAMEAYLQHPEGYIQQEYRSLDGAGEWRWVLTRGKVLEWDEAGKPLRIVGTHQDITEKMTAADRIRKMEVEMLNLKIEQQINQSSAFLNGQEEERRRLARELHDGIGQQLNVLKIQLSLEQTSAAVRQSIDSIIDEIVRINNNLMPLVLQDFGLEAGLRQLLDTFRELGSYDLYFYCDLKGERFSMDLEIAAFRIAQEATTNAIKYAKASHISLQLIKQDDKLVIMIEDNGIGFNPSQKLSGREKGFGLLNMQYRVEALKGNLYIESSPGQGCLVNAILPILK